ncbi:hypothetical protein LguiB_003550 [Lonicera macranthoides]
MRMQGEMRRKFGGGRASGSDGYDFNYRMAVDSDSEAITASNGFRGNIKNVNTFFIFNLESVFVLHNQRRMPAVVSGDLNTIRRYMPSYTPNSNAKDEAVWSLTSNGKFSCKSARDALRDHRPVVHWYQLVSNKDHVRSENRDHLFFTCCYAKRVWDGVKSNNSCASWCDEVDEAVRRYKRDSLPARVGRGAMAAVVYSIWYEQNQQIFANKCKSESQVSEDLSGWAMNKSLLFKTAGVLVGEVHAILPD